MQIIRNLLQPVSLYHIPALSMFSARKGLCDYYFYYSHNMKEKQWSITMFYRYKKLVTDELGLVI
jgi:hypothetical protein